MKTLKMVIGIVVAIAASQAHAGTTSAKKRAQLEAEMRGNAEVQKHLDERVKHLDRAVRAAEGIDKVIDYATKRSGTNLAYKAGKKVGEVAVDAYKKRKNK